jgi:flagellar biosynthetic protein FliQ
VGDLGRDFALALASDTLWTALLVASPVLVLSLLVGLAVSILQAVTQIQEATLSFIPKIVAVVFALVAFGAWMMNTVIHFATRLIGSIPLYF